MNLQQLRHLVALAELGSFSLAAEHCHLTQPALSRSIAQLEEELGLPVVDRIGRRNEITTFGQMVMAHARNILGEADALVHNARLQAQGSGGHFRLGLGSTPAALLTAPLLLHAATHCPHLRLTITRGTPAQQMGALVTGDLDAVVLEMSAIVPSPELDIELLAHNSMGFFCRVQHPLAKRRHLDFQTLLAWPITATLLSDEQIRMLVSTYGPQGHPAQSFRLRCEDIQALLHTAVHSDAIYFGVQTPALDLLHTGALVQLPVSPPPQPALFGIIRLAGRSVPPAFTHVQSLIRSCMNGSDANSWVLSR